MSEKIFPRQVDFIIDKEDWGIMTMSDGTKIKTRIILSDIVVNSEDVFGPEITLGHVVAVQVIPSPDMAKKVESMPLPPPAPIPLTPEAGYEKVEVIEINKPTESTYHFEGYLLTVKMEVQSVARNLNYRLPNGAPLYNIRWSVAPTVTKA